MADEEKIVLVLEADDEASQKVKNLSKNLQDLDKNAGGVGGSSTSGISNFVSSLERGIDRVNSVTRHYNRVMSGFNRMVINGVQEMGSAVYDFTTDAIDNFTEFSEQHAKTLGAMAADYDNTSESQKKFFEDAQKLKEQAMQIGTYGINGTGSLMSVPEVSQAQTELIKAGVSASDIVDPNKNITKDVLTFAQANDLSTGQAVEFAVSLGNQFNIPQEQWGDMLDKVSHTADMSVIDVADIVQSMKYAGGITSGLGRDLEETLGMVSILSNFGLKGSQAGSGIQALLTRLLTGDTTVITEAQAEVAPPNALKAFYDFSNYAKSGGSQITYDDILNETFTENDITGNLRPMTEVIDTLDEVMAGLDDEEQAWFAKKLFGLYQMKSAYGLINGDETNLDDVIKEIRNQSSGTNANKLEQLLNSQYGQLTSLNNLWEGIKTDVGDRLNPFVQAIRDELFNFLSNDGNYNINFDNLRGALDESCDLIEEKYGSAIANAVRNIGDVAIDLTQVGEQIAPALGDGLLKVLGSLFDGNIIGDGSVFQNWGEMIDNMHLAVDGLPEEMQGLGDAVVSTIDWFGKLCALNVASEIAELVSSVLQILTIAGGAVINVAGAVVVNGSATGGTGVGGGAAGGAGSAGGGAAGAGSALKGSSVIGSADDVANALGTTADDVISTFGKQATYSVDDIARGLGTSADDVISAYGQSIDDIIKAGAGSVDEVARGGSKLFGSLSKTGKALGALGTLWQVASSGYEAYQGFSSGDAKAGTSAIAGGGGSLGGGFVGAEIGTAIAPGLGTVIGAIIGSLGGDKAMRELTESAYDMFDNGTTGIGVYDKKRRVTLQNESAETLSSIIGKDLNEFEKALNGIGGYTSQAWKTAFTYGTDYYQYSNMNQKDQEQFEKVYVQYKGREYDENSSYADELARSTAESARRQQETTDALKDLGAQMVVINKNNDQTKKYYDPKMDELGQGYYSVWTGTQKQLEEYLNNRGQILTGPDYQEKTKTKGATEDNPYMIEGLSEELKNGIVGALSEINKKNTSKETPTATVVPNDTTKTKSSNTSAQRETTAPTTINASNINLNGSLNTSGMSSLFQIPTLKQPTINNPFQNLTSLNVNAGNTNLSGQFQIPELKLPDTTNQNADSVTINSGNVNATGSVNVPNIDSLVRQIMPNGYAALSDKGKQDLIQNEINNQINIDDTVTMQPSFSVAAPNVNVNVHVDKEERVIKQVSILNPQQGTLLNNWYSRTSSQYGKTTK
jgi:TP901 family phage tail tape measure protein